MSNLRRSKHSKNDRYEIPLYSDPQDFQAYQENPVRPTTIKSIIAPKVASSLSDIAVQESYLTNLQSQIEKLKNQIDVLQGKQTEKIERRLARHEEQEMSESRSYSIQSRKSNAGRIIKRGDSVASKRRVPSLNKQPESTYYKWQPQIDSNAVQNTPKMKKDIKADICSSEQNQSKLVPNIRVKQKSFKQTIQVPSEEAHPAQKKEILKKKFKTQKILSQNDDSSLHQKQRTVQQVAIKKDIQVAQQPEQLKEVFPMTQDLEIISITDDFRSKMLKKLRIPHGFPLQTPDINNSLESYQQMSKEIYSLFGMNVDKFKQKLIVRKFKNGVYYQMKPNKNILWYFNGAFYFGQWDTDLPSQAEKNGFGFQYIPGRYFYLGEFKNGNRNGKGVIKIINEGKKGENFVAYDGEWLNGKPHGYGKHIDEHSHKYMGSFDNGEKTGKAKILNSDGLYFEGEIVKGVKNGHGVEKFINGDVYTGNFLEGKFHGKGIYQWSNGSVYEGQFRNGIREGKGVWKSYNGDQFEGQYSNDVKHGWGKFLWRNGQIYEGEFKMDIRDGLGAYKHASGKIGRYLWKDGHIDRRLNEEQQKQYKEGKETNNTQPIQNHQQPPLPVQ